jgi:hypothetical protein
MALRPPDLTACTATGLQLAARLSGLAGLAAADAVPAYVGRRMSAKLEKLEAEIGYLILLQDLAAAIDPDRRMTRKALARAILAALLRAARLQRPASEYRLRRAQELLEAGFNIWSVGHLERLL